jgi:hypothetical protein
LNEHLENEDGPLVLRQKRRPQCAVLGKSRQRAADPVITARNRLANWDRKPRKLGQYPAKFMVALATGNKMRSRPGSTPNGLLVSVPAYSRFPDGLVGVPAREQIVYCLILTREREP